MELDKDQARAMVAEMVHCFDRGEYEETLRRLDRLGDISSLPGSVRVPAVAIGARAMFRIGEVASGDALLKKAGRGNWTDVSLYDSLAIAMIEAKDYGRALELVGKSAELKQARKDRAKTAVA